MKQIYNTQEIKQKNFAKMQRLKHLKLKAKDIMTLSPKIISSNANLSKAQDIMNSCKINSLLVVENFELVGIVQMYDLGL